MARKRCNKVVVRLRLRIGLEVMLAVTVLLLAIGCVPTSAICEWDLSQNVTAPVAENTKTRRHAGSKQTSHMRYSHLSTITLRSSGLR